MKKSSLMGKSSRNQDLKSTRKALNKIQVHNFDDIDSLSYLKQKKSDNIDDKFKLLKSELHSLFLNPKVEGSQRLSENALQLKQTESCENDEKQHNSSTSVSPNPTKFSKWLSDTIEKIEVESLNSKINKKLDCGESLPPTANCSLKSKYNMTLLPTYKVERLIYKSFQLQNLGIYVISSSDESDAEQLKSNKIRTCKKRMSKKASKGSFSSSFPRKRKRACLGNNVEITHSKENLKKNNNNKVQYVDLDLEDYDWNEPFYAKNSTDSSDLEIIDDDPSDFTKNKIKGKQNDPEGDVEEVDIGTNAGEQNNSQNIISGDTKRTWECPICLETSQGQIVVATMCGHIFCKVCLEKHNSVHGKFCPTCRLDLSDKPTITLFNI